MIAIFMMSAKLASLGLLKITVFWNKGNEVIAFAYNATSKFLSRESNCIVDVVMWAQSLVTLAFFWEKFS